MALEEPITEQSERRILLRVEYDGGDFHGWQVQHDLRTVQETLQTAVHTLTGEQQSLRSSSRTDAGVHAEGLPVLLRTQTTIPLLGFVRGLNGILPSDLAIQQAVEVDEDFDPRRSSLGKIYQYTVWNGPIRSALQHRTAWYVRKPLDLAIMRRASNALIGTHNFESFRASGCQAKHAVRTLEAIEIGGRSGGLVTLTVRGNAFLQHMVRILAGTLVEIGRGLHPENFAQDALQAQSRACAGQTAPAKGLRLIRVLYDPCPFGEH